MNGTGRVELVKVDENVHQVLLSSPSWQRGGDALFRYHVEFKAKSYQNISMHVDIGPIAPRLYPNWPPTQVGSKYFLQGLVGMPGQAFQVEGLSQFKIEVRFPDAPDSVPYFDIYYVDQTVSPPTEELLGQNVTSYTWGGVPWQVLAIGIPGFIAALALIAYMSSKRR